MIGLIKYWILFKVYFLCIEYLSSFFKIILGRNRKQQPNDEESREAEEMLLNEGKVNCFEGLFI